MKTDEIRSKQRFSLLARNNNPLSHEHSMVGIRRESQSHTTETVAQFCSDRLAAHRAPAAKRAIAEQESELEATKTLPSAAANLPTGNFASGKLASGEVTPHKSTWVAHPGKACSACGKEVARFRGDHADRMNVESRQLAGGSNQSPAATLWPQSETQTAPNHSQLSASVKRSVQRKLPKTSNFPQVASSVAEIAEAPKAADIVPSGGRARNLGPRAYLHRQFRQNRPNRQLLLRLRLFADR